MINLHSLLDCKTFVLKKDFTGRKKIISAGTEFTIEQINFVSEFTEIPKEGVNEITQRVRKLDFIIKIENENNDFTFENISIYKKNDLFFIKRLEEFDNIVLPLMDKYNKELDEIRVKKLLEDLGIKKIQFFTHVCIVDRKINYKPYRQS